MVEIASNKHWQENKKDKHRKRAKYGWYRYESRFAIPIINVNGQIESLNIYRVTIIVNYADDGMLYLYDMQDIKKETGSPTQDI